MRCITSDATYSGDNRVSPAFFTPDIFWKFVAVPDGDMVIISIFFLLETKSSPVIL
jgi:hypothetical protein